MKLCNLKLFLFSLCLIISLAFSNKIEAQEIKNTHFDAGLTAYKTNNFPLAFDEFLAAAKLGHPDSQFNIGLMYENGIGVAKDEKKAVLWYDKAAEQGLSNAQFNLAVLYENGRGTKVDYTKAREWYRKASAKGDALAVGNLGMLYIRGQGVKQDKIVGIALLLISATNDVTTQNNARRNIASTRGLSTEMIAEAQKLSDKLSSANNLIVPLDTYLKSKSEK